MNAFVIFWAVLGAGAEWKVAAQREGITVYTREAEGQNVAEVKAEGLLEGTPHEVWAVVRDYPNYDKNMPYTQESKILSQEDDGKTIQFYSVVNAPLVSKRDYVIRITDESDWKEGKGYLKSAWTAIQGKVPERSGYVRLKLNDGHWRLEPRENGQKTWATYYVLTDPGGAIPKWIANQANNSAVPDVFRAVRKLLAQKKK